MAFILLVSLALCGVLAPLSAQTNPDYAQLLREADRLLTFEDTDLAAEYLVETRTAGGGVSTVKATMFRRDRTDQFLVLVVEPLIDKGKGYLKEGNNIWLWDPVGKRFIFTDAQERFQNSSVRHSDFNRPRLSLDYTPLAGHPEKLGKFDCTVLELQATAPGVPFPRRKVWISADGLIRKIEDYSLSGRLLRATAIPSYQKLNKRWTPATMVIQDYLRARNVDGKVEYERTTVTVGQPSLKALPDTVYTKEYLERVAR